MKDNALYLEVDEDITSAIDKLGKADGSSVQIVVPKRSALLQSIINLKLLKKAASDSGKELVLVTNDRLAGELAARVGLAVAPSLGAKPVLHEAEVPAALQTGEEIIEADDPAPAKAVPAPVTQAKPAASKRPMLLRRRNLDEAPAASVAAEVADSAGAAANTAADTTKPAAKSGGPKVPNFARLQRRVLWLGAAVVLIGGYFVAMYLVASADVTLYANGTKVNIDTTFSADPNLKATDKDKAVLAAQTITVTKDLTGPFTPTGKKDVGTKAGGSITISNCLDTNDHTFVSGTRFQAPDGKMFRSTAEVVVPGGQGSFFGCTKPGTVTVEVQAEQSGDSYNEAPATYSIPGLPASQQTGQNSITAKGAQMSGGTSKTITIVTQADVDAAKTALIEKDKDNATRDLQGKIPSGYTALAPTQATAADAVTPSPAVDAEGSTGNLTVKVTYTVLTVKQSEYQELVRAQEVKQIGNNSQIYDDGIESAQLTVADKDATGRYNFHLTTEAYGGAKIDTGALAAQLKGKRYGDAAELAAKVPGVGHSEIVLKPSWSTALPGRADKIKVTIQVTGRK